MYVEDKFVVVLGGNTFVDVPNLVVYKGESLFTLRRSAENGYLGIDFTIYNAAGEHLATIKRNEVYRDKKHKDDLTIEGSANRYTLTEKPTGRVICDIKKSGEARPAELDVSVDLYTKDGFHLQASSESIVLPRSIVFAGNLFSNLSIGIRINDNGSLSIGVA